MVMTIEEQCDRYEELPSALSGKMDVVVGDHGKGATSWPSQLVTANC
jgi:hypothetical protein